jgi:hypothetical protein
MPRSGGTGAIPRSYRGRGDETRTSQSREPVVPVCINLILPARGNYMQNIAIIHTSY